MPSEGSSQLRRKLAWLLWIVPVTMISLPSILFSVAQAGHSLRSLDALQLLSEETSVEKKLKLTVLGSTQRGRYRALGM